MLARRPSHRDATVGDGLREVQRLGAVGEHRRKGETRKQPALVDLADVSDEVGLESVGLGDQAVETLEQLVVRDVAKRVREFHDCNIRSLHRASQRDRWQAGRGSIISNEFCTDGAKQKEGAVVWGAV